jgi:hypothetical protein
MACASTVPPAPDVIAAPPAPVVAAPAAETPNAPLATTATEPCVPATAQYAADAPWFINGEAITIGEARYVKSGPPQMLGASTILRYSDLEKQGVPIYIDVGLGGTRHAPMMVHVPVRPGCVFQTYKRP